MVSRGRNYVYNLSNLTNINNNINVIIYIIINEVGIYFKV